MLAARIEQGSLAARKRVSAAAQLSRRSSRAPSVVSVTRSKSSCGSVREEAAPAAAPADEMAREAPAAAEEPAAAQEPAAAEAAATPPPVAGDDAHNLEESIGEGEKIRERALRI